MSSSSTAEERPTTRPSGRLDHVIEQILQADRLIQVDQVDKARDIYQRVVELDPGNAIAMVGLAQCALADGDDELAHELAGKALTLDPENDMARRMEARLSEIMSTRGEPVERPAAAATPSPQEMRPMITEPGEAAPIAADAATSKPSAPVASPATNATPPGPSTPAVSRSLFDRILGR